MIMKKKLEIPKSLDKKSEAIKLLQEERLERQKACGKEVHAILEKYKCVIEPQIILSSKAQRTMYFIVAEE